MSDDDIRPPGIDNALIIPSFNTLNCLNQYQIEFDFLNTSTLVFIIAVRGLSQSWKQLSWLLLYC